MRSTASESPIQLLLHLSSPFGAGSRSEVVDAEEYKATCMTVLVARIFFHFQIEVSPCRARQSLSYFVNRPSRSFQEIVSFSLFDFLDSFQTLKAQKTRKHNLNESPKTSGSANAMVTDVTVSFQRCENPHEFPRYPSIQKKSRHFRPRRPGRGCRGT